MRGDVPGCAQPVVDRGIGWQVTIRVHRYTIVECCLVGDSGVVGDIEHDHDPAGPMPDPRMYVVRTSDTRRSGTIRPLAFNSGMDPDSRSSAFLLVFLIRNMLPNSVIHP